MDDNIDDGLHKIILASAHWTKNGIASSSRLYVLKWGIFLKKFMYQTKMSR